MAVKKDFRIKLLSVVIPSYQQEKTIIKDVKNIKRALDELDCKYEIIVVIDGMVDETSKKIRDLRSKIRDRALKIIAYEKNQGKGHAVRVGMLKARGNVIGFIDAGMDIDPTGLKMLLNHMDWYEADVIVGSKLHPVSRVNYPLYRKVLSWGYRLITKALFGFKVRDTQVGLKFFKRKVVKDVLPRLLVKAYAFDIEILAVAYYLGYKRIYEAPVKIKFGKQNTISVRNLLPIVFFMLWDTAAVFYRLRILKYYKYSKSKRKTLDKFRLSTLSS